MPVNVFFAMPKDTDGGVYRDLSMLMTRVAFVWGLLGVCGSALAAQPATLQWDVRLRHEGVSDDAFARNATAETLRARVGFGWQWAQGWSALLEGEGIANASGTYNSGANRRNLYPTVIDPRGVELNQAWVGWKQANSGLILGRQRYGLDNQRFVGNVGWRQNEQTFDALALQLAPFKTLTLRYAWLDRVHRASGDQAIDPLARERGLSTHLFNASYQHATQQWVGYAYLHQDRDVVAASSATVGARWIGVYGDALKLGWSAEFAHQRHYANNPLRFNHRYWLLEPSVQVHGITYKIGWESLGGDGRHALQTPLATLHAFNGWADKFLITPNNGLQDRYASVGGMFGGERVGAKPAWLVAYHAYRPTSGIDARYGREWDASLSYPIAKGWTAMAKLAEYNADAFAADTRKVWLQLEWKGSKAL